MSELFPGPAPDPSGEPEPTGWQDPRLDRAEARRRWRIRAAQWRALALARAIFGEGTGVRLSRSGPGHPFRGLLHLKVPFRGMEDHRRRESVFLACAARDPVVAASPFIFVFDPVPAEKVG